MSNSSSKRYSNTTTTTTTTSRRRRRKMAMLSKLRCVVAYGSIVLWGIVLWISYHVTDDYDITISSSNNNNNHSSSTHLYRINQIGTAFWGGEHLSSASSNSNNHNNHNNNNMNNNNKNNNTKDGRMMMGSTSTATIAFVITITGCGPTNRTDEVDATTGEPILPFRLMDGAAVLQYSIHLSSIHGNKGGRYDYALYAVYHPSAKSCVGPLQRLGYELLERDTPIVVENIQGDGELRTKITSSGCCGEKELIKLEAYTFIQHPIVVLLDIDALVLQPLDPIFDYMLLPNNHHNNNNNSSSSSNNNNNNNNDDRNIDSIEKTHHHHLLLPPNKIMQWPNQSIPREINIAFTYDYAMMNRRNEKPFQGGLLILKPNVSTYEELKQIVLSGDYVKGRGWGGKMGPFWGAMTIQGLLPYYYDILHPGQSLELNRCIYNNMCDNPNYVYTDKQGHSKEGSCLTTSSLLSLKKKNKKQPPPPTTTTTGTGNTSKIATKQEEEEEDDENDQDDDGDDNDNVDEKDCEDCRLRPFEEIVSIHFTNCRKPWLCLPHARNHKDHNLCRILFQEWYRLRTEMEQLWKLQRRRKQQQQQQQEQEQETNSYNHNDNLTTATTTITGEGIGTFRKELFYGHCHRLGHKGYIPLMEPPGWE